MYVSYASEGGDQGENAPQDQPASIPFESPGQNEAPQRVVLAMNYVLRVDDIVLRPRFQRGGHNGVCGDGSHYENLIEQDLHPAQYKSFQAACDVLTDYFNDRPDRIIQIERIHPELIEEER